MSEQKTYQYLFNPGGCLTAKSIQDYMLNSLSIAEKMVVDNHTISCELCKEAIEGYGFVKNKKSIIGTASAINIAILKSTKKPVIHSQIVYYSAAASVVLLVGIGILFWYYQPLKDTMLAVQQTETKKESDNNASNLTENNVPINSDKKELKKEKDKPKKDKPSPGSSSGTINQSGQASYSPPAAVDCVVIVTNNVIDLASTDDLKSKSESEIETDENVTISNEAPSSAGSGGGASNRAVSEKSKKSSKGGGFFNKPAATATSSEDKKADNRQDDPSKDEPVFTVVEVNATFQGGDINAFNKWASKQVVYPVNAVQNNIEGKVIVQFAVNSKGEVVDVKVSKGVDPSLDEEAVRVVKSSPKWIPAKQSGAIVKQQFMVPIVFQIQK